MAKTYDQKHEFILRTAARIFAEKSYHSTSMRDISRATGVSLAGLSVDYAFQPVGDLGSVQRVSLTYRTAVAARTEVSAEGGPR